VFVQALFIGQTYIDVTFVTDHVPVSDEKHVASEYAVSFGGNAVTAAFCCAKLGLVPDLITTVAPDWLGRMFLDMAAKYAIPVHSRHVRSSSLSFIMPKDGKRAIVRCRDAEYLHPFPHLNLAGCRALHLDGHQPDAAIHYAKLCRSAGILTSLDGGGVRANTHELLEHIDVAIVAERLCEQMKLSPSAMLEYLKSRGCRIGGVSMGERGLVWYDETGFVRARPAERTRHRHQRGRGRAARRLHPFVPRASGLEMGGASGLRPGGSRLQDPAPRQRGGIADARRCGGGAARIRPDAGLCEDGRGSRLVTVPAFDDALAAGDHKPA
jgi:sugar/nucleoside kinase (ribokinase family)